MVFELWEDELLIGALGLSWSCRTCQKNTGELQMGFLNYIYSRKDLFSPCGLASDIF